MTRYSRAQPDMLQGDASDLTERKVRLGLVWRSVEFWLRAGFGKTGGVRTAFKGNA